jgi:hypothetical protein
MSDYNYIHPKLSDDQRLALIAPRRLEDHQLPCHNHLLATLRSFQKARGLS